MTKGGAHFGGLTYTRQVPAFLQKMQEQDQDGIAGALKKREGQEEREERSDNEEKSDDVMVAEAREAAHKNALTQGLRDKTAEQGAIIQTQQMKINDLQMDNDTKDKQLKDKYQKIKQMFEKYR